MNEKSLRSPGLDLGRLGRFRSIRLGRGLCGPVQAFNILIIQEFCDSLCLVRCNVIVHEEELKNHKTPEKTQVKEENLCTIVCTSDWIPPSMYVSNRRLGSAPRQNADWLVENPCVCWNECLSSAKNEKQISSVVDVKLGLV